MSAPGRTVRVAVLVTGVGVISDDAVAELVTVVPRSDASGRARIVIVAVSLTASDAMSHVTVVVVALLPLVVHVPPESVAES